MLFPPVKGEQQGTFLIIQRVLPVALPGACPDRFQPGPRPLTDLVALKLSQRGEDVKDQLAARRVRLADRFSGIQPRGTGGICSCWPPFCRTLPRVTSIDSFMVRGYGMALFVGARRARVVVR
jgi:hypothetical protein